MITHCPVCGAPLNIIEQPALLPGRAPQTYADCTNIDCALYAATDNIAVYEAMTPEQIEAWAKMPKRLEEL